MWSTYLHNYQTDTLFFYLIQLYQSHFFYNLDFLTFLHLNGLTGNANFNLDYLFKHIIFNLGDTHHDTM